MPPGPRASVSARNGPTPIEMDSPTPNQPEPSLRRWGGIVIMTPVVSADPSSPKPTPLRSLTTNIAANPGATR